MTKRTLHLLITVLIVQQSYSQSFEIKSPDESIQLTVNIDHGIFWTVSLHENAIVQNTKVGMNFSSGPDFGMNPRVIDHSVKEYSSMIYPAVPYKDAEIKDKFVQLTLTFKDKYQLHFRAYNDGVAYKFIDDGSIDRNVMSTNFANVSGGNKIPFPERGIHVFTQRTIVFE